MLLTEKTTTLASTIAFLGLLIALTLEPIFGSYVMLGGLSVFALQVFIWELKYAKISR